MRVTRVDGDHPPTTTTRDPEPGFERDKEKKQNQNIRAATCGSLTPLSSPHFLLLQRARSRSSPG